MLYWIWLTQINGVGPKRQRLLLERFDIPENIYRASSGELLKCPGIGNSTAKSIVESRSLEKSKHILDDVNKLGIKLLTIDNTIYPLKAKSIEEMPILLYYRGHLMKDSTGVGIIGSRRCSEYGKRVVHEAATYLVEENIVVVYSIESKGSNRLIHEFTKGLISI